MMDGTNSIAPQGCLNEDINKGFRARTHNYVKPLWTTEMWMAATSFELIIDEKCESKYRSTDVTHGSTIHCDCRYLIPKFNLTYENPIKTIYFSHERSIYCTENINEGRSNGSGLPLHLCWKHVTSNTYQISNMKY